MKKNLLKMGMLVIMMVSCVACGKQDKDPGNPPVEVINSENNSVTGNSNSSVSYDGSIMKGAVKVKIGTNNDALLVDMVNNAASHTMLNYLSRTEMRFPGYTYSDEGSYVAQNVRGSYTRNDEETVTDIKAGDLYLFSDGQLRLYFRDIKGANITATPIGYFSDRTNIEKYVTEDYAANVNDAWGVKVYFLITKQ